MRILYDEAGSTHPQHLDQPFRESSPSNSLSSKLSLATLEEEPAYTLDPAEPIRQPLSEHSPTDSLNTIPNHPTVKQDPPSILAPLLGHISFKDAKEAKQEGSGDECSQTSLDAELFGSP